MIHYLPSCAFTRRCPESEKKLRDWLTARGIHVCGCCKECQNEFQPGDTVLYNCTSCRMTTAEQSPQVTLKSIYQYLNESPDFPFPDYGGEAITVQDCLRNRGYHDVQDATRIALRNMNMVPVELVENRDNATYDGTFFFNPLRDVTIAAAPKTYAKLLAQYQRLMPVDEQMKYLKEHFAQYTTPRVVTVCVGCYAGTLKGGANGVHLLDLMAGAL